MFSFNNCTNTVHYSVKYISICSKLVVILISSFVKLCMLSVCQDVSGMSLSMLAAAGGQDDILRLLIKKGARVNARQKNGTTALMHAAEKVTSTEEYF